MKLTATIVLALQARTLAEAGATLDEILAPAGDRADVDLRSVELQTPSGGPPVTLPQTATQAAPPPGVPHPLPNGR